MDWSANVLIQNNKIVFRRSQVNIEINIGGGTEPKSFRFVQNQWFAEDKPAASKPNLPSVEQDGIYGQNPRWRVFQRAMKIST